MALPELSMRQLLEAGVHFGHTTRRWNPKMAPYLFGVRNNAHIIDLQQTVPLLHRALVEVRDIVASGGRVLFVGTKRQAAEPIAAAAKRCGQFYVNQRWLGGTLTNWKTISVSIRRLRALEEQLEQEQPGGLTKKELLRRTRLRDKLERSLGGIKDMGGLPDLLFVLDTNKEAIAIAEANKLDIPVVAVIDSNSDPDSISYVIPGNDDAIRAISLYCQVISDAVLDGIQEEVIASGVDIGASEEAPQEALPEEESQAQPLGEVEAALAASAGEAVGAKDTAEDAAKKPTRAAKTEDAAKKAEDAAKVEDAVKAEDAAETEDAPKADPGSASKD
ncbi:MAG: 30S ribosomal protein S2 [Proteobacteria bacterium]|nr:30S ribosomal protein S2 [Pseudomonadota bacterium]